MHLRVFTELEGNAACTGAAAQWSTRVSARENCRHFRMTHVSNFMLREEETPDILSWFALEDSAYRHHLHCLNFTFALCSNLGTCAKFSFSSASYVILVSFSKLCPVEAVYFLTTLLSSSSSHTHARRNFNEQEIKKMNPTL